MPDKSLELKLQALLKRKAELEEKLGVTRATEKVSTRKSDTKYRVSSARAVQARSKKGEKAMLKMVNQMIVRTKSKINQQK
jgi:hypothetical protein